MMVGIMHSATPAAPPVLSVCKLEKTSNLLILNWHYQAMFKKKKKSPFPVPWTVEGISLLQTPCFSFTIILMFKFNKARNFGDKIINIFMFHFFYFLFLNFPLKGVKRKLWLWFTLREILNVHTTWLSEHQLDLASTIP